MTQFNSNKQWVKILMWPQQLYQGLPTSQCGWTPHSCRPAFVFLPFSCSSSGTRLRAFRFNLFFLCLMAVLMVKREQAGLLSNNALSWLPINSIFQPADVYLKTQKERLDLPDQRNRGVACVPVGMMIEKAFCDILDGTF